MIKRALFLALMRMLAILPLCVLRFKGWLLGKLAYRLVASRRKIVLTNLRLCFPQLSEAERVLIAKRHFVLVLQSFLDRAWLWHGRPHLLKKRLRIEGDAEVLALLVSDAPTVIFAPHFVGLDAGGMALSYFFPQMRIVSIYSPQSSKLADDWMIAGRTRFGNARVFSRFGNIKSVVKGVRAGERAYLLPDMDFGVQESVFVPFFGVQTATLTSLSRFAQLGRAEVVTVFESLTPAGYTIHVRNDWQGFPSDDETQDAAKMNHILERYIQEDIAQYYWVHKRFKTRPEQEPSVY